MQRLLPNPFHATTIQGIASLPATPTDVKCMGTGATFTGEAVDISNACAVSIVRAGDSLLEQVSLSIFFRAQFELHIL
jgi:uracil phosphoribosyltransferase